MKKKETIFGQVINNDMVHCYKCNGEVGLSSNAWFDPYVGGGKYVHRDCLSDKRKIEIVKEEELYSHC